jgi:flavin-binding protein dodecin
MSEHTYKIIELVGPSHTGIEAAVRNAVAKAAIDEKSLRWFEVVETRGHIEDGKVAHWQVRVSIGASLKPSSVPFLT